MKTFIILIIILLSTTHFSYSQVGIGTKTPDDGSMLQIDSNTGAFVPPRMNNTDMSNIPTPLDGAMVFNTTYDSYYVYKNGGWSSLSLRNGTLSVNNSFSGNNNILSASNNTYYDFPIGAGAGEIIAIDNSVYSVTGDGTVTILKTGNYLFTAALSPSNMPSGSTKYILAMEINGSLVAYLTRGYASLPSNDWWGASGNVIYPVTAGDVIKIRYVLNNGGIALHARIINFGMTLLD
jgi:hypothetical protein